MQAWNKLCIASGALALALATAQGETVPVKKARGLVSSGRLSEAEHVLRKAIAETTGVAELHGELGMLLYGSSHYEEAVEQLGRAAQLEPDSARYSIALAEALIGWRHFAVAADFLRAVASKFDPLPEYHYNLGLAYYGIKDYYAARSEFENTAKIAPKLAPAYFFLGNSYAAMGDLAAGVQQYRKALELEPDRAAYCLALGRVLSRLGPEHEAEALRWIRKSLVLKPDDAPSKFYLALAYEKAGDLAGAKTLLEEVSQRYPEDPAPHIALARVYNRSKEREKADRESAVVRRLEQDQLQQKRLPAPSLSLEDPAR